MYFPGLDKFGKQRQPQMPDPNPSYFGGLEEGSEEELQFFALDDDFEPEPEDIQNLAYQLGIDPQREQNLLYIAREGLVLPPPEPWILAMNVEEDLYWVNQETEEILEHPPNIDDFAEKVEMVRNRQKKMKKRNNNQKKNAMMKILGRNIPDDAIASDTNTNPSTAKKKGSKSRRGRGRGGGGFGLLKHLKDPQNVNDGSEKKLGVIKQHSRSPDERFDKARKGMPGKVKRTNVKDRIKEKDKTKQFKDSGKLLDKIKKESDKSNGLATDDELEALMSSSELGDVLDDPPMPDSSDDDEFATVPSSMKKGKIEGSERFFDKSSKKKGGFKKKNKFSNKFTPSRKEVDDIIDAISIEEDPEENVEISWNGSDEVGMAIDPATEGKNRMNENILFDDKFGEDSAESSLQKRKAGKISKRVIRNALDESSSHYSFDGEEGEEEYDADDILEPLGNETLEMPEEVAQSDLYSEDEYNRTRQKFSSYETPSIRSKEKRTPQPQLKRRRSPEKSSPSPTRKKDRKKKSKSPKKITAHNFEELQKLSHPESFPGYELVDSNLLFSMVKQIEQMQDKIEGLEVENKQIKVQNDQIMRKTQLFESSTLKTVSMVSNNPWNNTLADRRREDGEIGILEDDDDLIESIETKGPPPKPKKNASVIVSAEVLNLKNDIQGIKSFLAQSILQLTNKIDGKDVKSPSIMSEKSKKDLSVGGEKKAGSGGTLKDDSPDEVMRHQNSLLLMNKWMSIVVKEKQRLSRDKTILKNQRDKIERRKFMLKTHELEMATELQKMGLRDKHSLTNKIRRSLVMQIANFKDDYKIWKDKVTSFKVREKNLEILEGTLVSTNSISSMDARSDEHLQELYKAYLQLEKRSIDDDDLRSLDNSDMFDQDPLLGSIQLANVDLTNTVELDDDNKPKRPAIAVNGVIKIDEAENEDDADEEENGQGGDKSLQPSMSVINLGGSENQNIDKISENDADLLRKSQLKKNSFMKDNTMRLSSYGSSMLTLGSSRLYQHSNYLNDLSRLRKSYAIELKSKLPAETLQSKKVKNYFAEQNKWFGQMQSKLKMMKNSLDYTPGFP